MSVHDFLNPDVLGNVPEGGEAAFSYIAREAYKVLLAKRRPLDVREDWSEIQDAEYTYISVVLNAAKRYGISPLKEILVPKRSALKNDAYRDLNNDIEGYLAQLLLSGVRLREISLSRSESSLGKGCVP